MGQRGPGVALELAMALSLAGVLAGGCSQAQSLLAQPFVGEVEGCEPRIDAVLCRRIAETAVAAIGGPAVSADTLSVSTWDSCENDQVVGMAPAAAGGATCYSVMGGGYAGGERLANGAYRGGTPVEIEAVVWADENDMLQAAVKVTEVSLEP